LQNTATQSAFADGRNYFLAERVRITKFTDELVQARVFGARIHFAQIIENDGKLSFSCDCPRKGIFCKHKVAIGLAVIGRLTNGSKPLSSTDESALKRNRPQHTIENPVRPQMGTTRPQRVVAERARVRRLKPWENLLANVGSRTGAKPEQGNWKIIFFLDVNLKFWNLKTQKVFIKRDGSYGRLTRILRTDTANQQLKANDKEKLLVNLIHAKAETFGRSIQSGVNASEDFATFDAGESNGHFLRLLEESEIYFENGANWQTNRAELSREKGTINFLVRAEGSNVICQPYLRWGSVFEPISTDHHILTSNPVWLKRENVLIPIEGLKDARLILPFQGTVPVMEILASDLAEFLFFIEGKSEICDYLELEDGLPIQDEKEKLQPRLYLMERSSALNIELKFGYGNVEFEEISKSIFSFRPIIGGGKIRRIHRDVEGEEGYCSILENSGVTAISDSRYEPENAVFWLHDMLPNLIQAGFEIFGESDLESFKVLRDEPQVEMKISTSMDWFDIKIDVSTKDFDIPLSQLRKAIKENNPYVLLPDGSTIKLPDKWFNKFKHLFRFAEVGDVDIKVSKTHATLIDVLANEVDTMYGDSEYEDFVARLHNFKDLPQIPHPKGLKAELREYQREGLNWLIFMRNFSFGSCLADDMGLGKTVQALALMVHTKEETARKPNLIVAPTSVIFNWEREIEKFAPDLTIVRHTGNERKSDKSELLDFDIVLTTYGILRRDFMLLREIQFHYCILDESQYIKNPGSQTAKSARLLMASHRLALTGTPIENNLTELWSQFAFLNPGMLGSLKYFQKSFSNPIEKQGDVDAAELLQKLVFPFIMRRTKVQVAQELPPKTESVVYTTMHPEQQAHYDHWRDHYRASILKEIDSNGLQKSRFAVLEGLTKLRQIACHPMLIDKDEVRRSGKYDALMDHLDEILAEGHKVLVFSQFVKMLTLLRENLDKQNINYEYLDGSTRDREACVDNFQTNPDIKLFLISLRAGGTGLNLTAADYVIHFDPWWNPAVEVQATDRSHRIGQDKHVFVYKFISRGTVEEKVLKLQERKQQLVEQIISTDRSFFKQLSQEDITDLFS